MRFISWATWYVTRSAGCHLWGSHRGLLCCSSAVSQRQPDHVLVSVVLPIRNAGRATACRRCPYGLGRVLPVPFRGLYACHGHLWCVMLPGDVGRGCGNRSAHTGCVVSPSFQRVPLLVQVDFVPCVHAAVCARDGYFGQRCAGREVQ